MTISATELDFVAADITRRLGYLDVVSAARGALPRRCADIHAAQLAGDDPTAPWRSSVRAEQSAFAAAPPQVAAAFVLQWYLSVAATPLAWAATLGPWVLDADPAALSFDLAEPGFYPVAVGLTPGGVDVVADETERLAAAEARYRAYAEPFAAAYDPPEVRVGSGQKRGIVHDMWTMAREDALAGAAVPGARPARRSLRRGCCMRYALPGGGVCTACPRTARTRA